MCRVEQTASRHAIFTEFPFDTHHQRRFAARGQNTNVIFLLGNPRLPMDLCPKKNPGHIVPQTRGCARAPRIFWSKNVKKVHFCVIFASFPVIFFVSLLLSSLLYECITSYIAFVRHFSCQTAENLLPSIPNLDITAYLTHDLTYTELYELFGGLNNHIMDNFSLII